MFMAKFEGILVTAASIRPTSGPTQPPVQRVPAALYRS